MTKFINCQKNLKKNTKLKKGITLLVNIFLVPLPHESKFEKSKILKGNADLWNSDRKLEIERTKKRRKKAIGEIEMKKKNW